MIYETVIVVGLTLIFIAIVGDKKIEIKEVKIGDLTDIQRSIIGVLGIIVLILGFWQPTFIYHPETTPAPVITPTLTPVPTPTPTPVITPTVTPTPTQTPSPKSIQIIDLQEGDEVSYHYLVKGDSNVTPDSELKIYVLIKPLDYPLPWYVQPPARIQSNGDWEADAYFGRNINDRGHYNVCAITTAEELYTGQTFENVPKNDGVSKIIKVKHTYTH